MLARMFAFATLLAVNLRISVRTLHKRMLRARARATGAPDAILSAVTTHATSQKQPPNVECKLIHIN